MAVEANVTRRYRYQVFLIGYEPALARQVLDALRWVIRGAGKVHIRDLMKRAEAGERILVYRTNDRFDAEDAARRLKLAGAKVHVDGITTLEEIP